MGEEEEQNQAITPLSSSPLPTTTTAAPPPSTEADPTPSLTPTPPPPPPPPPFDPSRMIGIIKRKALIKELAAVYHAECLAYCQQLLELQKKPQEPFIDLKTPDELRKETMRPPKRLKKSR